MNKSDSIKELGSALAKAQGELKPLAKNSSNPFFKSNYADLSESVEKILPVLSKHGLSISQGCKKIDDTHWGIETLLIHSSGEWISYEWPIIINKAQPGPQDFASSSSYARRYSIQAIVSAAAGDDDDANKAQGVETKSNHAVNKIVVKKKEVKNFAPTNEPLPPLDTSPPPETPQQQDEITFESDPRYKKNGSDFLITFGKYTGKTVSEVGLEQCQNYAAWLKDSSTKAQKPMSDTVKTFCDFVLV